MENRVGFGKRLGALCIDAVLCIIAAVLTGPILGGMFGGAAGAVVGGLGGSDTTAVQGMVMGGIVGSILGAVVAIAVIFTLYFLVEGFTGWTLGKLMLGIQIANADGTRAPIGTLLLRYAIKNSNSVLKLLALVSGVSLFSTLGGIAGIVIFIGCFFALGRERQALHDMIAKTAVYPRSAIQG
jgi:uncharacterized RDD family membrane protein YckC